MKIRKSLMLAGMLGAGFVTAPSSAQVYVCMACPAGTYSDGNNTNCAPCPAGTYCHAGVAAPENCQVGTYSEEGWSRCSNSWKQVVGRGSPGGASGTLAPGQYRIDVSGATGGSGGSYRCLSNPWRWGKAGGKGGKSVKYIYLATDTSYSLSVGWDGGNGGDSRKCNNCANAGGWGGASSVTLESIGVISASGGGGAGGCCSSSGGGCGDPSYSGGAARGEIYIYRLQPQP